MGWWRRDGGQAASPARIRLAAAINRYYTIPYGTKQPFVAHMLSLALTSAAEQAQALAARVRALRLRLGWTQVEAAGRSGMTLASYKRFERTGEIALRSLLKLALVMDQVERVEALFQPPPWRSLDEAMAIEPKRQRAPRRRLSL